MTVHMDLLNKMFAKPKYDAVLGVMSKLAPIDSFAGISGVLTLALLRWAHAYLHCSQYHVLYDGKIFAFSSVQ